MLPYMASLWIGIALTGQAPAEGSWLKSVPADVPVAIRARALDDVRGQLLTMLKTMSPAAAQAADGPTAQALEAIEPVVGRVASKNPFLVLMRLPDPAQPGVPAWGAIIKSDDYKATIAQLAMAGGESKTLGGYDSFAANAGQTWYATKGDGWAAFGPDEAMIKSIRKPEKSLASTLAPEVQAKFLAGDLSIYVSLSDVWEQYGQTIEQVAPAILAQMEQNPNAGGPQGIKSAKLVLDGLTAALKQGKDLVLTFDFESSGLSLAGLATVKDDAPAAKASAEAKPNSTELLASLPNNMMFYVAASDTTKLRNQAMQTLAGTSILSKNSPRLEEAVAARTRALGGGLVSGMSLSPMEVVTLVQAQDPVAAIKATLDAAEARKELKQEKNTIERNALTYGGFELNRIKTTIDRKELEKAVEATGREPAKAAIYDKIMPGNTATAYVGTDGKLFLEMIARSDDESKARIDTIKNGSNNLGSVPSWKTVRAKLPREATALVFVNAQALIRQMIEFARASNGANAPEVELPKSPALVGFGLVASPRRYDFQLVVPSEIGPVVEAALGMAQGR